MDPTSLLHAHEILRCKVQWVFSGRIANRCLKLDGHFGSGFRGSPCTDAVALDFVVMGAPNQVSGRLCGSELGVEVSGEVSVKGLQKYLPLSTGRLRLRLSGILLEKLLLYLSGNGV